jgi:crossover junction endodeoxyribonuclease RuvC
VRVLGIDPGLSRCGVGVVEGPPQRPVAVRAGVIRTPPGHPVADRLAELYDALRDVIAQTAPDAVAVERVFFNGNARTAMGVGQAAGVALLCAARAGVPVVEYTPTQVKAAVAGSGAADKEQVIFMVRAQLRLAESPRPPDAADALALALCHLQRAGHPGAGHGPGGMSPRLAAAVAEAGPGAPVVRRVVRR